MVSGMGRNKNLIRANVCMEPDGVTWFQARWDLSNPGKGKSGNRRLASGVWLHQRSSRGPLKQGCLTSPSADFAWHSISGSSIA